MKEKRSSEKGFTLLETLIAVAIFALIGGSFVAAYLTGDRLVRQGLSLTKVQAEGRLGMEKMERELRMANSATVSANGDQVTFVVDTNGNPSSPNYVTRSLVFSTGDGNEATSADNVLTYDPDTSNAGDEQTVMKNVRRMPGQNIFSISGNVVSINVRTSDVIPAYQSTTYSGSNVDIATQVRLRNAGSGGGGGAAFENTHEQESDSENEHGNEGGHGGGQGDEHGDEGHHSGHEDDHHGHGDDHGHGH